MKSWGWKPLTSMVRRQLTVWRVPRSWLERLLLQDGEGQCRILNPSTVDSWLLAISCF